MEILKIDDEKTLMQNVKQRFFAFRNGVVADMLRHCGSQYKIIFGLNIPQLREIASAFGYNAELARQLWENSTTRESRLLAPMLFDPAALTLTEARELLEGLTPNAEEVDILCHSLLRHTTFARQLLDELNTSDDKWHRYTALRLEGGLKALAQ